MLEKLRASTADRLTWPGAWGGGASARFTMFLLVVLFVHVAVIGGGLLWEGFRSPPPPQEPEPISVEVVEEPAPQEKPPEPAPPPPPPAPEPQPQQDPDAEKPELPPTVPLDEAPAHDAPKSARNDAALTTGDNTQGPPVVAALPEQSPPAPTPMPEPAKPVPEPAPMPEPVKAEPQAQPKEEPPAPALPPDPDGVPANAQATPPEAAEPPKLEPDPTESEKPETPDAKRFAFFAPLPKMDFDTGANPSRAPSGAADSTYTSMLYGMIVPLVRVPPGLPAASRRRPLRVEFVIDGRGRLVASMISRSSGVPFLDMAALAAVRQAAPFPPTPHGKPLGLVLDYAPE